MVGLWLLWWDFLSFYYSPKILFVYSLQKFCMCSYFRIEKPVRYGHLYVGESVMACC